MSNISTVHKHRLYFTQCNAAICLRCPICTQEKKSLRQCKIYKNFPSLWRHIKLEHDDILPGKSEEVIHLLTWIFKAFNYEMFPK